MQQLISVATKWSYRKISKKAPTLKEEMSCEKYIQE